MKHSDYIHKIPIKNADGRVVGERSVVSFAGLLDLAHAERLTEINTTIAQLPSEANFQTAVVHATVTTGKGKFTGIGDANPRNVNPRIAPHIIRMAETRAIGRSLRTALNIGAVCLEELGDESDVTAPAESQGVNDNAVPTAATVTEPTPITRGNGTSSRATDAQRKFLYRLLQQRGIEGDAARTFLQKELGTPSVAEAPKHAVSALIDRLQHDAANGTMAS